MSDNNAWLLASRSSLVRWKDGKRGVEPVGQKGVENRMARVIFTPRSYFACTRNRTENRRRDERMRWGIFGDNIMVRS